jgi:hypothetical protein
MPHLPLILAIIAALLCHDPAGVAPQARSPAASTRTRSCGWARAFVSETRCEAQADQAPRSERHRAVHRREPVIQSRGCLGGSGGGSSRRASSRARPSRTFDARA